MRFFSLLAAAAVSVVLAMSILARPQLYALLGMGGPAEAAMAEGDSAESATEASAVEPNPETKTLVKVVVRKIAAQQVDSAVILRGQTAAARQVDARAETSAVVSSAPLRNCLLYTSPSPRDLSTSRMPSSA